MLKIMSARKNLCVLFHQTAKQNPLNLLFASNLPPSKTLHLHHQSRHFPLTSLTNSKVICSEGDNPHV